MVFSMLSAMAEGRRGFEQYIMARWTLKEGTQLSAKVSAPSMCEEWGSSGRGCLRSGEKPASINGESRGKTTESNSRSHFSLRPSIPSAVGFERSLSHLVPRRALPNGFANSHALSLRSIAKGSDCPGRGAAHKTAERSEAISQSPPRHEAG